MVQDMYEKETQWIRGLKGTEDAGEGCLGKKKTKKGRCKRKGKNQDYICHSSLPAHSEKLQKRSGNREEKNDSQILLFQPLSHGRKLLIL